VVCHEFEAALPSGDVEVGVAEPGVSVVGAATPFSFGHVVVEMDVHLLVCELGCNGIVDLYRAQSSLDFPETVCQCTCSLVVEAPNCGLFLITFWYTTVPLLVPSAFWNAFWIVTSPPLSLMSSIISIANVSLT
jgi:hypothetical protein